MQQESIHNFLERYFSKTQCEITEKTNHHLSVQLTIDMDKKLMNRPFYWHYLEKTGGIPQPMNVTFITNQNEVSEDLKGEIIYFGSPRLHQIFNTVHEFGSFIRVYENTFSAQNRALTPWLGVNFKITYQCDRMKEILISLGLHLITGKLVTEFHDKIANLSLTNRIPDYRFTLQPIIKPQSGILRLEKYIEQMIEDEDHKWAVEAENRWREDMVLLEKFYENLSEKPSSYEIEKKALREQYEPRIEVDVLNGGLFYLESL